jgi:nanoRNase/pAp phosphatase (c-di-AMP/oligoRNAs hydrolase)
MNKKSYLTITLKLKNQGFTAAKILRNNKKKKVYLIKLSRRIRIKYQEMFNLIMIFMMIKIKSNRVLFQDRKIKA